MNKLCFSLLLATLCTLTGSSYARYIHYMQNQASSKVSQTTASGVDISINYTSPALRGRTIGKDAAPYGQVWSTGADGITTFEVSRDVIVENKTLRAGKYRLYSIPGEEWTFIFSKALKASKYSDADDALRITLPTSRADSFSEKMLFTVNREGIIDLLWGNIQVRFLVQ